jgi:transcriptional regulator with XRE-family HTH domain
MSRSIAIRFGLRLRRARKKKGWSQVHMAERLGIDRGHLSDLELGKKNATLPTLEVLAQGLDISLSELMKGV